MVFNNIEIKKLSKDDFAFIKEMVYEAIYVHDQEELSRSILEEKSIKKYYEKYGSSTDIGFIATDKVKKINIGAIWLRLLKENNQGFGYVDDYTPELTMAVNKDYRGKGIGTLLMDKLLEETICIYPNISLSVDPRNKAYDFYLKNGFKEVGKSGTSITLLLKRH